MILNIPLLLIGSVILSSCATTAIQEKLIDGKLQVVEKLTLKGIKSDKRAKFSDKSEIEDKSGLSDFFPDIEIDLDKLK